MTFYNPFKKTIKKKSNKPQPTIIADIHEKNSLVISELHSSNQINLEIKPLKIADYIIGKTAIERKTTNDFVSSMINKRLIQQLNQMQKYKQAILIIEGKQEDLFNNRANIHPNAIRGFMLSIINNHQIPIIQTQNSEDTSAYLITLAKQQLKPNQSITLHSRIPKTLKEQKQYILESFPNIGPKKAELLIQKFKTLSQIFNTSEDQLQEILKKQSQSFKKILES